LASAFCEAIIAKSIPYTIDGPVLSLLSINKGAMRFVANQTNTVEYDFAVMPPEIGPEQIRMLGDVARLGGKILASNTQGIPVIGKNSTNSTTQQAPN